MEDETGNKISPFCIKVLILILFFGDIAMLEVEKGSQAPSEGTYIRHWTTQLLLAIVTIYNAALMMILCFSGDIIHLFPYRKSGITFRRIYECNICL